MLQNIFIEILNMSLTASVMIIAILWARVPLKKTPRIYTYLLWGIVLFRLLCPISFETEISLLGVLQHESAVEGRMEYIPQDIGYQMEPEVHMPVAAAEVLDIDQEKQQVWVEVSKGQAETFLKNYGAGIYCGVISKENSYEGVSLTAQNSLNPSYPADGVYNVAVRSIAKGERCIDRYAADIPSEFETEQTELYFAENCDFFLNEEMTSVRYREVSYDEFVDCAMWDEDGGNASCNLTFQNGLITKAEMLNPLGKYGIRYQGGMSDTWYPYIMEMIREEEGVDALETYFTLVEVIPVELSEFEEGEETIEIYTGNIGDGDSGIVLFKNARGEVLGSETAHQARAGWNNIYLVEDNGKAYILTVYIEDRDTYGGYGYQVYEIGPNGMLMQRAGTIFEWGGLEYDDELFKEWVSGMEYYLRRSYLLLSSQEGEIRTEHISEADKYNYETLKRE